MRTHKPCPLGVLSYRIWRDIFPDPTLDELLARFRAVNAAILRYRKAGLAPHPLWLLELGLA